ncbi:MAG: hypothetical protein KDK00_15500 [Rhodobacteraceae bacterium]|nr:hypothetical protein [Paracoccaceae bacterium]
MSGRTTLKDLARLAKLHEQAALAAFGAATENARRLEARIATLAAPPVPARAEDLASIRVEANWTCWRANALEKLRAERRDMQPALDALRSAAAEAVGRKAALDRMIRDFAQADRQIAARRVMAEDQVKDFASDILAHDVDHQHVRSDGPQNRDRRFKQ